MRKANAGKSLPTSTRKANVPSKNLVTSQTGESTTTRVAVEKSNCHIDKPSCGSRTEKNAMSAISKAKSFAEKGNLIFEISCNEPTYIYLRPSLDIMQ